MISTRQSNTLDIFLSNRPSLTNKCRILPGLSDHDIVHISARLSAKRLKKVKRTVWDFNKRDKQQLQQNAKNFTSLFLKKHNLTDPVEKIWTCLKTNIMAIMEVSIPTRLTSNSTKQVWITNKAKKLCRLKKRWHKKAKLTDSLRVKNKYLDIKRKCRQECRKAKTAYLNKISEDKENKQLFWNYVKSKRKDNVSCSQLKDKLGKLQSDAQTKANLLNDQFSSVWSAPTTANHFFNENASPDIDNLIFSIKGVHKLLSNLKPFKATGPDGLPPFILKDLAYELAPAFTLLFEASLRQGTLPQDWKSASVVPIFKKKETHFNLVTIDRYH